MAALGEGHGKGCQEQRNSQCGAFQKITGGKRAKAELQKFRGELVMQNPALK